MQLYPVKLSPAYKDYLWGGSHLKTVFNKNCAFERVAESWELSAHTDGLSTICGGMYDGLTLTDYLQQIGKSAMGSNCEKYDYFPLLIKLIDAQENLSVQVHPSDEYALTHEGEYGKTEMWYILDCKDGASLYYGFSHNITVEEYRTAIQNGNLTDILRKIPVKRGDVFFIPAGTVHAIGSGILICEIQQNSNTTYRVFDYNRRDKDGNLRPLHIEKAVAVSNLNRSPDPLPLPDGDDVLLATCEYFEVKRLHVNGSTTISINETSFVSLVITDGHGELIYMETKLPFTKGDSIFIPAQNANVIINGHCEVIRTNAN